jgi:hypothetical protein
MARGVERRSKHR